MKKAVWLTWENQRRNKTLSQKLGVELFQLEVNLPRIFRYPWLVYKTLIVLLRNRPDIIFAQNPSIFLALLVVIYGRIFSKVTVIDCHNAGIYPFNGERVWAQKIAYFIFQNSDLIIVSNSVLKKFVEDNGGEAIELPDPFPVINGKSTYGVRGKFNFLLICTWAQDEPYEEVIKAFFELDNNYVLYVSGNSKGKEKNLSLSVPDNVVLTGYLSNNDFDDLLCSCDSVIDLTTRDDCLVCGAYEAVAAGKPLILSNTNALKKYFKDAALYTENNLYEIKSTVEKITKNLPELKQKVLDYSVRQEKEWDNMVNILKKKVSDLTCSLHK